MHDYVLHGAWSVHDILCLRHGCVRGAYVRILRAGCSLCCRAISVLISFLHVHFQWLLTCLLPRRFWCSCRAPLSRFFLIWHMLMSHELRPGSTHMRGVQSF